MVVNPLGHVCDMGKILQLCKKYNLILIGIIVSQLEQNLTINILVLLEYFHLSPWSTHHISSVEGGMILTDDNYYADIWSIRANGWLREVRNTKTRKNFIKSNPELEESFMFPYIGFNFKPTDMSAALVSNQINKLNKIINKRIFAAKKLINLLKQYENFLILPSFVNKIKNSWFTFPIVVKPNKKFSKKDLVKFLSDKNIANRPIAGNIADQPFLKNLSIKR